MSDFASQSKADAFVRKELVPSAPPPLSVRGFIGWVLEHLFSSWFNIVMTVLCTGLVLLVTIPLVRFLIIDATWYGETREACLQSMGACWPFIKAKFGQFIYGFYPAAERWRPNIVFGLGALLLAPLLIPSAPYKRANALIFFGIYPIIALILLTGGNLDFRHFIIGRILPLETGFETATFAGLRLNFWVDYFLSFALILAIAHGLATILGSEGRAATTTVMVTAAILGLVIVAMDVDFGLVPVETRAWGGLLVTLVVAVTGIVASLPLGILLALGRRSEMPTVRILSIIFIEFWRGVPLITVLFFATYMLPLFLPGGTTIDGLLRALIGVALFSAAYMAEVVRGGLQAIPKGQYEGAAALGLGYWQTTSQVVMPQALTLVIPGIVNNFIGLFKDTTLVLIVAIFDLLGQLRASFTDPAWATPTTLFTGFAFGGIVYFIFCFGMSRYSQFVERYTSASKRH